MRTKIPNSFVNPYEVLGPGMHRKLPDATLRDRFRKLARGLHPDKPTGDKEKFVLLVQAFRAVETMALREALAKRMAFMFKTCRICRGDGCTRGAFIRGHQPVYEQCKDCNGCGYYN